jgi:hypothetical protein
VPVPSLQSATVIQKYTLRYEAQDLPQILLVQEDEPETPETLALSYDLDHSSPHWIACATWSQANRDGFL